MPATGRERVAAGVLVGTAAIFVGFAIPRVATAGFLGALTLPLVLLAADLVIAAAVVTWWYPLRPVAQGLAVFGILVHALVLLRSGLVWTRGCSAVLLLAHSWALVQLFLMTAAEDDDEFGDVELGGHEPGEHEEHAGDPPFGAAPGEQVEILETPVTDVVDVAVPAEADTEHEASDHDEADHGEAVVEDPPDPPVTPDEPEHEHEGRIR